MAFRKCLSVWVFAGQINTPPASYFSQSLCRLATNSASDCAGDDCLEPLFEESVDVREYLSAKR